MSIAILEPVGIGESQATGIDPIGTPARGQASGSLSGSFSLDGSGGRMVSLASSASAPTHANGDRLGLAVGTSRTGSGFDLTGGVVARSGAAPGLYATAVSVVVNYN